MIRGVWACWLVLLQAAAIGAILIPSNLADGLYTIPFDSNGTALSDPIFIRSAAGTPSDHHRSRRQNPPTLPRSETKCGTGGLVRISEFTVAKANLQAECDKGDTYPARTAVIFITGTTTAYFCNYDAQNRCWRQEYEDAMNRVVQSCGSGRGGEVYIPSYLKSYGGDNNGQQVCRF